MKSTTEQTTHRQTGRPMFRAVLTWSSARGEERLTGSWTFDKAEAKEDAEDLEATWLT